MIKLLIPSNRTAQISVGLVWLFHISGMLGIFFGNREFFLETTPINLFFTLALLFVNLPALDKGVARAALLAFLLGMIVEILGVNYGLIFGNYTYGDNLGFKVWGVPLLIGANWAMLSFITGSIGSLIFSGRKIVAAIAGAVLMVLLDLVIEPVAPKFDYWEFSNPVAPLSNYVGWFLVALPIQLGYQYWVVDKEYTFSAHLVLIHFLFFGVFALL